LLVNVQVIHMTNENDITESAKHNESELCFYCLMKEKFGRADHDQALGALAEELERVAEEDPDIDDGGRRRAAISLNVILHWFAHGPQRHLNLNLAPLYSLLAALDDLEAGAIAPMLRPRKVKHRPRMTHAYELAKRTATGVCNLLIKLGYTPNNAATAVCERLTIEGFPYPGKLTPKTILNWRARDKSKPEEELAEEFYFVQRAPRHLAYADLLDLLTSTIRYNCLDRPKFKQAALAKTPLLSAD
jgi:hypothetical protein